MSLVGASVDASVDGSGAGSDGSSRGGSRHDVSSADRPSVESVRSADRPEPGAGVRCGEPVDSDGPSSVAPGFRVAGVVVGDGSDSAVGCRRVVPGCCGVVVGCRWVVDRLGVIGCCGSVECRGVVDCSSGDGLSASSSVRPDSGRGARVVVVVSGSSPLSSESPCRFRVVGDSDSPSSLGVSGRLSGSGGDRLRVRGPSGSWSIGADRVEPDGAVGGAALQCCPGGSLARGSSEPGWLGAAAEASAVSSAMSVDRSITGPPVLRNVHPRERR